jgi:hypothetical protein
MSNRISAKGRRLDSRSTRVAGGGDDNLGSSSEESLDNLDSDRSLADSRHEGVLVLEGDSRRRNLLEDIKVERTGDICISDVAREREREWDSRQLGRVLPGRSHLPLEVEERDLVVGEVGGLGDGGRAEELARGTAAARRDLGLGRRVLAESSDDLSVQRADRLHVRLGYLRLRLDEAVYGSPCKYSSSTSGCEGTHKASRRDPGPCRAVESSSVSRSSSRRWIGTHVDAVGHLGSSSHLSDVLLETRDSRSVDLLRNDLSLGGNSRPGSGRERDCTVLSGMDWRMKMRILLTVLVEGSLAEHLATVLDQRLTKLLGESVILSSLDGRVVDGVLHVVDLWTQEG